MWHYGRTFSFRCLSAWSSHYPLTASLCVNDLMKLLVAEDSLSMRKVVVRMLHAMGYDEVLESPNGADAWEKIQHNDIDLLLTDYNMPLLSGLELTQRVRGQYNRLPTPNLNVYGAQPTR